MATYSAYELVEGACLEDVESLCAQLTIDGSFTDESQPKATEVERWLTLSKYWIGGILASIGISPTQTLPAVVGILQELNALDVAVKCELANPITGVGEPNERFLELKRRWTDILTMITDTQMLVALGATQQDAGSSSQLLAISGVSRSRKRTVESDTDYLKPRFRRGWGKNPRSGDSEAAEVDYYPVDD